MSFLNHLTLIPALSLLDDEFWSVLWGAKSGGVREHKEIGGENETNCCLSKVVERDNANEALNETWCPFLQRSVRGIVVSVFFCLVLQLTYRGPFQNLLQSKQAMNQSFDIFRIVNTYGAFGSVGKERYELLMEATNETAVSKISRRFFLLV